MNKSSAPNRSVPSGAHPDIGSSVYHSEIPALVVKVDAVDHNLRTMAEFCRTQGVDLAPHAKTAMMPDLFDRQLKLGAIGLTVSTPQQLRTLRRFNVNSIIYASQVASQRAALFVSEQLASQPEFEFVSFVDSVSSLGLIAENHGQAGPSRPWHVALEVGYRGGRTGVRTLGDIDPIVNELRRAAPYVKLVGVAGFEGLIALQTNLADDRRRAAIESYFDFMDEVVQHLTTRGLLETPFLVTVGGSASYEQASQSLVAREWAASSRVVLRGGCYAFHDHGVYASSASHQRPGHAQLVPAIEVLAPVLSTPEPGLVIVGMGRRNVGKDHGFPILLYRYRDGTRDTTLAGSVLSRLDDQHGYLMVNHDGLVAVGDVLAFGVSHPCTTLDKWRHAMVVDSEYAVIDRWRTHF